MVEEFTVNSLAATDSRNGAYIRDLPLLARLPDDDLKALASRGRVRRFTSGATIFHEGDPGDAIYVVVEGRIRMGRVERGEVDDTITATGSDELPIGRGDLIQTRRNDPALSVANRQRPGF